MESRKNQTSLRFLIATDVHLGHRQQHPVLGEDSFNAFNEAIQIAKQEQVDFMLLGGDLFDVLNPTQKTLYKCLSSIRENIFGDLQLPISVNGMEPNFSDENINISLPIFTIHGNHDYPSIDFGRISVYDLLHTSKFVNYFGKQPNMNTIRIKPITMKKGDAKVAIYGLGWVKDIKLNELFADNKVIFEDPPKGTRQDYVNIFILHQNRYKGKRPGAHYDVCVHPHNIPSWIDLTIWCHQHQSIPKVVIQQDRKIYQPGSTVITSFIEAESLMKHVPLITITKKQFNIQPKYLQKSHRPMFIQHYQISQIKSKYGDDANLQQYFQNQIHQILHKNRQTLYHDKKPIIRMKIQCSGHQQIRQKVIEKKFDEDVANPDKIFQFWRKKVQKVRISTAQEQQQAIHGKFKHKGLQYRQQMFELYSNHLSKQKFCLYGANQVQTLIKQMLDSQPNYKTTFQSYFGGGKKKLIDKKLRQNSQSINNMEKKYRQNVDKYIKRLKSSQPDEKQIEHSLMTSQEYKIAHRMKNQDMNRWFQQVRAHTLKNQLTQRQSEGRHSILKQQQSKMQLVISDDDEDNHCKNCDKQQQFYPDLLKNNFQRANENLGTLNDKNKKKKKGVKLVRFQP